MTKMSTGRRVSGAVMIAATTVLFGAAGMAQDADREAAPGARPPVDHARLLGHTGTQPIDQSRIRQRPQDTDVVVSGTAQSARIVVVDEEGDTIYEADPQAALTAIAKDAAIPTVTILQAPNELIQLRIVTGAVPKNGNAVAEMPVSPAVPIPPAAPAAD